MTILTSYIKPPIPSRDFDWQAWIDGGEEGPFGYGRTEAAAIADLEETIEERN